MRKYLLVFLLILSMGIATLAQQNPATEAKQAPERVTLPPAAREGGMPLNETLAKRQSIRTYTGQALTQQELGQLLWAAQGVNRPNGHRTAPSAIAIYPLELYAVTPSGFFHYLPAEHQVEKLSANDFRQSLSKATGQPSIPQAGVVFVFTAVWERMDKRLGEAQHARSVNWAFAEAGHAAQNVLLEATALNLACVPMGGLDPNKVQQTLPIPQDHTPIYMVAVGHPK